MSGVTRLEQGVVRIETGDGEVLGAGVLVTCSHVMTCAHVVDDRREFKLRFLCAPAIAILGEVLRLGNPDRNSTLDDVACLEIHGRLPDEAAPLLMAHHKLGEKFFATGFPAPKNEHGRIETWKERGVGIQGEVGIVNLEGFVQIETTGNYSVDYGFSGTPAWSEARRRVIGLLVQKADGSVGDMLPVTAIREFCPDLALGPTNYFCMADPPPRDYVQREKFKQLKSQLLAAAHQAIATTGLMIALKGAGGFGKTTLAQTVSHDEEVQSAYPDGVLWISMGEDLHPQGRLSKVRDLLRRLADHWLGEKPPAFENLDAASEYLRSALLQQRKILLIVDDVWSSADLHAFKNLNSGSTVLITTRDSRNLRDLTEEQPISVDAMQGSEAVRLLTSGLVQTPERAKHLVERLGYWPILLKLVNRYVLELTQEDGLSSEAALHEVETLLEHEGLEAFDEADEQARERAIGLTVTASLRKLVSSDRDRYHALAIFPKDTRIPLTILRRLWRLSTAQTRKLCRGLYQRSLLLHFDGSHGTIRLHAVMREYLRDRPGLSVELKQKYLLGLLRAKSRSWPQLAQEEPYLWQQLAFHLSEAGADDELRDLLFDLHWLQGKLSVADVNSVLADFDYAGEQSETQYLQATLRRSAHTIAKHPEELRNQLIGRFLPMESQHFHRLVKTADKLRPTPRLSPLRPCLNTTNALLRVMVADGTVVSDLAILPDRGLVSAHWDSKIRIWKPETGEVQRELQGHKSRVYTVAVLEDGCIASSSKDLTLRIWDSKSGRLIHTFADGGGFHLEDLGNGRLALAAFHLTVKPKIRVWDLRMGRAVYNLRGHKNGIGTLTILSDGRLASGSTDRTVRLWDVDNGDELLTFEDHQGAVLALAELPNACLAVATAENMIHIWCIKTGDKLRVLEGHEGWVRALAILPDGRLASGSDDGTIRIWNPDQGELLQTLHGHEDGVWTLAGFPDGRLASGSSDGTVRIWDPAIKGAARKLEKHPETVNALTTIAGNLLVSASNDTMYVWEPSGGTVVRRLHNPADGTEALLTLSDGRFVSASYYGTICFWEPDADKHSALWQSNIGILAMTELRDGDLVTACVDCTVRVWDHNAGKVSKILQGHRQWVQALVVLKDGRLVTASLDNTLRIWDMNKDSPAQILRGHEAGVKAMAVLPDGHLVSASEDRTLRIWNSQTGQELPDTRLEVGVVRSLNLLPNGHVVTIDEDHALKLWDLEARNELDCWTLDSQPTCVTYLPKFHGIAVGDRQGHVHVFRLE